jgi:hypothetical protein
MSREIGDAEYKRDRQCLKLLASYGIDLLKRRHGEPSEGASPKPPKLPKWERATSVLKLPYATLAMIGLQEQPHHFGFALGDDEYWALKEHDRGFMNSMMTTLAKRLERSVGYYDFWLALSLVKEPTRRKGRTPTIIGCVGVKNGDADKIDQVTADFAGSRATSRYKFRPVKRIAWLTLLATETAELSRADIGGQEYSCIATLRTRGRAAYQKMPYDTRVLATIFAERRLEGTAKT